MDLQLYMWSGIRERYIKRHEFFVREVRSRVLPRFGDINAEAEEFAEREYERLGALPAREDIDLADLAGVAHDNAVERYMLLDDLRKQVLLGVIAGMYHQWDKDLRDFLEAELQLGIGRVQVLQRIWKPSSNQVIEILELFGWHCSKQVFYPGIDACGLVVNVYKHGKGKSLEKLSDTYPRFVRNPLAAGSENPWFTGVALDHEWLSITEPDFEGFAASISDFWNQFPERLFLTI